MDTTRKSVWFAAGYVILIVIFMTSCAKVSEPSVTVNQPENTEQPENDDPSSSNAEAPTNAASNDEPPNDAWAKAREQMVTNQLAKRDIVNQSVLDAMRRVPRHQFVSPNARDLAYRDSPLGIGKGQTISQPYIVALMTQLVDPKPHHKALDIGTGSGYQAAILAELVKNVYSIEIVESLATEARDRLQSLGYKNIEVRHGDGYRGWKSEAPFDLIIVAAAPDHIPEALIEQLAAGGKLVIPVGDYYQTLKVVEKQPDGTVKKRNVAPVAFVPMTGEAEK